MCSFCRKKLDVEERGGWGGAGVGGGWAAEPDKGKGFRAHGGKPFCQGCFVKLYG